MIEMNLQLFGGRGAGSSIAKGGIGGRSYGKTLPELEGTEKQIKWANDIRQNYIENMDKAKDYYRQVYKEGSFLKVNADYNVKGLANTIKFSVSRELEENGNKYYKKYKEALEKEKTGEIGREERRKVSKQFFSEVAKQSADRLDKNVNKILKKKEAKYFIDNRRILIDLTEVGAD